MKLRISLPIVLVLVLSFSNVHAQYLGWDYQEQARSRNYDIAHIEFHISFNQPEKEVIGKVLTTLSTLPQPAPVRDIVMDEVDLQISKVWVEGAHGVKTPLSFDTSEANKVRITLDRVHPTGENFTIGIDYTGHPHKGMYFTEPDSFYTQRQQHIWTQGEGEDNRRWFPTYDYPNDKMTTDMFVTVRADQQALSNGKLVGKQKNKDGTVTWHWNEASPYSTYLVTLAIGKFDVVTDMWHNKPVEYWLYPGWGKEARRIFGLTPKMIEFFSTKTQFPYAWEKYAQVAVADFTYGGMENVSATTLNDYVMFDKRAGIDFNAEGLIAHELAHQWFGDVVTCRSWIQMWLNESFATYFEGLFREYQDGKDEFDEEMQNNQNTAIGAEAALGKKPIVAANNYTANQYPRGATVLNMIRKILGDEGFWASIHHYLDVHKFNNVTTEDFKMAIEEATGQNLQWFFDEYLYHDGHPVFNVTYNYDDAARLVRMSIAQTQPRDSMTGTFRIPVDVELTYPDGTTKTETLRMQDSSQNFTIVAPQRPAMVIFDKGNTVLKELYITKSAEDWVYQLEHAKLAIERSQAAQNLGKPEFRRNEQAIAALKRSAMNDPFWSTRLYSLVSYVHDADSAAIVRDALVNRLSTDPRPDVRAAAVELLSGDKTFAAPTLESVIDKDSSYHVVGSALRGLIGIDTNAAFERAQHFAAMNSPRDRMRGQVVDILESSRRPDALASLIELVGRHDVPKYTRAQIIRAIGTFKSVDSAKVFSTLWGLMNNGDYDIRNTALNVLANIGDQTTLNTLIASEPNHPDMKVSYDGVIDRMKKRLQVQ